MSAAFGPGAAEADCVGAAGGGLAVPKALRRRASSSGLIFASSASRPRLARKPASHGASGGEFMFEREPELHRLVVLAILRRREPQEEAGARILWIGGEGCFEGLAGVGADRAARGGDEVLAARRLRLGVAATGAERRRPPARFGGLLGVAKLGIGPFEQAPSVLVVRVLGEARLELLHCGLEVVRRLLARLVERRVLRRLHRREARVQPVPIHGERDGDRRERQHQEKRQRRARAQGVAEAARGEPVDEGRRHQKPGERQARARHDGEECQDQHGHAVSQRARLSGSNDSRVKCKICRTTCR